MLSAFFLCAVLAGSAQAGTVPAKYHDHEQLTAKLKEVERNNPHIAKLINIGESVLGHELWVMEISDFPGNNTEEEPEPEFKYVANMHGDETVGRELLINFIDYLVDGYASADLRVKNLVDHTRLFIMPSMNPDGFMLNQRYNGNGVDLNRDFPDQFHDRHNTLDGRQPETQAMMQFTWDHHFVLSANLHGGALLANTPYDGPQTGHYSASPDDKFFQDVAHAYADKHLAQKDPHRGRIFGSLPNQGAMTTTNGAQWYAVFNGMQDWNYAFEGDFEITLEVSEVKYPPASELPQFWEEHKESLMHYAEQIHRGIRGVVKDKDTGKPLAAKITVEGNDNDKCLTDPEAGDFYRLLPAGKYKVTVRAVGYEPLTKEVLVTPDGTRLARQDFHLQERGKAKKKAYSLLQQLMKGPKHEN